MWRDKLLTEEQQKISDKNYLIACKYFGIKKAGGKVLHHIDPELRHIDIERYIQWRVEDLVVMDKGEHTTFHNKLRNSATCLIEYWNTKGRSGENNPNYGNHYSNPKVSESNKQRIGEKNSFYGKHHSDETKAKIGAMKAGVPLSDDHKRKISEGEKGRKHSEETKKKMSEARKAYWANKRGA